MQLQLVSFDEPIETREFMKGRFELYRVGRMTLGRASYDPGRKWSEHVGAATGKRWCEVEHVGLVLSGRPMAAMRHGIERVMEPGSSSTSRRGTTVGSSATTPTSRCTSWVRRITRSVNRDLSADIGGPMCRAKSPVWCRPSIRGCSSAEGLIVIQRQLGHSNLGITSAHLRGIDSAEVIAIGTAVAIR